MSERPFDVEFQDGVAQVLGQRRAHRRVVGQVDDVHVLVGEAQFLLGTDHSPGRDAANLAFFQFSDARLLGVGVPETGALHRKGHLEVQVVLTSERQQAGRPRHDDLRLRAAVLHLGQDQPVGVGVGAHGVDLAHDDFLWIPLQFGPRQANVLDRLHLQPGQRQPLGQFGDGEGDVHIVS